jgi:hypothetical protein
VLLINLRGEMTMNQEFVDLEKKRQHVLLTCRACGVANSDVCKERNCETFPVLMEVVVKIRLLESIGGLNNCGMCC